MQDRQQRSDGQQASPSGHELAAGELGDEGAARSIEQRLVGVRGRGKRSRGRAKQARGRTEIEELSEVTGAPPPYYGAPLSADDMLQRGADNRAGQKVEHQSAHTHSAAQPSDTRTPAQPPAQPRQTAYLVQPSPPPSAPSALDPAAGFSFPGAVALSSLVFVALRFGREQTIADRLDRRALAALADERKRRDAAARQASGADGLSATERAEIASNKARPNSELQPGQELPW